MAERPILFQGELVRAILSGAKTVTRRPVKDLHVQLRHEVASDLPDGAGPRYAAGPGVFAAEMNPHGAVSVRTSSERLLGVKPGEFDFLCRYADGHTYLRKYADGRMVWVIQPTVSRLWVRETWCPLDPNHYTEPGRPRDELSDRYGTPRRNGAAYRAESTPDGERCRVELGYHWKPSIHMPRWASRLTLEVTGVRAERLHAITEEEARAEGVADRAAFMAKWDGLYAAGPFGWSSNPWVWAVSFRRVA